MDDGSQDGTWEALQSMLGEVAGLELLLHGQNRWKGAALRTGLGLLAVAGDLSADGLAEPD